MRKKNEGGKALIGSDLSVLRRQRWRWYGHFKREEKEEEEDHVFRGAAEVEAEGRRPA